MLNLFRVDYIAFTIIGYPMSYVELIGTLFAIWSVWLVSKRNILTWPIGIVSVLLFMILFYQIRLYSDTIEQVYYLITNIYGWWVWSQSPQMGGKIANVRYSNSQILILGVAITGIVAIIVGFVVSKVHLLLPGIFPEPASFPYLDALTTVMSFSATWLMIQGRVECWVYWIIVDVIGIWLYFVKEVKFIALLYGIFLVMAINGLRLWHKVRQ